MDVVRVGLALRAIRRRRRWRQSDVAARAGVSQNTISRIERGELRGVTLETLEDVCSSLGASTVLELRWRGAELDRLLDARHAALASSMAKRLARRGWIVEPEISFARFGERGGIDLLGWFAASSVLLVIELKTELVSLEETLRRIDVKTRLAPSLAGERLGWRPRFVARLLVLLNSTSARRHVAQHHELLARAFPTRNQDVRNWLRQPSGRMSGLLFVAASDGASVKCGIAKPHRVRRPAASSYRAQAGDEAGVRASGMGARRT